MESRNPSEFLRLTDEEAALVELKLALARAIREQRSRRSLTQDQLGRLLGSSQSRVAKIEAADRSVSLDLMVRSLLLASDGTNTEYLTTDQSRLDGPVVTVDGRQSPGGCRLYRAAPQAARRLIKAGYW